MRYKEWSSNDYIVCVGVQVSTMKSKVFHSLITFSGHSSGIGLRLPILELVSSTLKRVLCPSKSSKDMSLVELMLETSHHDLVEKYFPDVVNSKPP